MARVLLFQQIKLIPQKYKIYTAYNKNRENIWWLRSTDFNYYSENKTSPNFYRLTNKQNARVIIHV